MTDSNTRSFKQSSLALLISLRPRQWTKNLAVFAALVFSQTALKPAKLFVSVEAFVIFCLISGSIYLINDVLDYASDKAHPIKRKRPIASGRFGRTSATVWALVIAGACLGWSADLGNDFLITVSAYFLLQVAYSFFLKNMIILDVFSIATGFVLRVIAGAVAISVHISSWLLICTMLLSLFLALSKRRHELVSLSSHAAEHRKILAEYSTSLLDQMISVVTSATVVSYALYTMSDETIKKFHTTRLIYTVPFVLYGVFRYLYLVHQKDKGGSPEHVLLTDGPLLICILLYAITVGVILYH
jgi:4-hydroxybenzoate polyprenyltransferase